MVSYTDLIGVPFKNNGRDINTGFDCYGLVMEVYKRHGIQLPEYHADYDNVEKITAIIEENAQRSCWRKEPADNLPVPCIVTMRFGVAKGIINHTGVYIGDGKFIHIRNNIGVCIDRVNSPAWSKVIEGYYSYGGD